MLSVAILSLALSWCSEGEVQACSLPGCNRAEQWCDADNLVWGPCTCQEFAGCVDGTAVACGLPGCAAAQAVCAGGVTGACQCAIQSCDDGNACTTDAVAGAPGSYTCTHAARTGLSCSDGDACNGAETCSAGAACLPGTPPDLNDGNACTYDYCDATGVHHDTVASCAPAGDGAEAGASPGLAPSPLAQPVPQMAGLAGLDVVENTGEVRYRYEFALPAARGRYQPALRLTYSSSSSQNVGYGHGWALSTSYIELSTQGGPYQLFLDGQPVALVSLGAGDYLPEIGGALVSLTASMAGWEAWDAAGNKYTFDTYFGWDALANGGRWYLHTVVDVDGNKAVYGYQREGTGPAARLTDVSYNNYLVSGVEWFAHSVALAYAPREMTPGTPQPTLSWAAEVGGSYQSFSRMLTSVSVRTMTSAWANLRSYDIGYTNLWKAKPGRAVEVALTSITPRGATGAALPTTTFQYDDPAKPGYVLDSTARAFAAPMSASTGSAYNPYAGQAPTSMWIDLDGDGLPDRVGNATGGGLVWARNTTVPGSSAITFAPAAVLPGSAAGAGVPAFFLTAPTSVDGGRADHAGLSDMNGDGLPDLVQDAAVYGATSCAGLLVRLARIQGGQLGYYAPTCFTGPSWVGLSGNYFPLLDGSLEDANFDGASDFVSGAGTYYSTGAAFTALLGAGGRRLGPSGTELAAFENASDRFSPTQCTVRVNNQVVDMGAHPEATCEFFGDPRTRLTASDLNGDGIPELISRKSDGTWEIQWGTGSSLAAPTGLTRPAGLPGDYVAARPERSRDVICECNYHDPLSGWVIAGGILSDPYWFWGWEAGFIDLNGDGIADYVTNAGAFNPSSPNPSGIWSAYVGHLPPILLRSVTTGPGATAAITYALASAFGAGPRQGVPWMATSLTISGPRLPSATSYFWYAEPKGGQTWYLPLKYEPRGFARTWVYDGATKLVRETSWATGSHVFSGSATRISWGTREQALAAYDPALPPTGYTEFRRAEFTFGAKARGSTTCTDRGTSCSSGRGSTTRP